jgi:NADH-quinone oxidoreductase subunit M
MLAVSFLLTGLASIGFPGTFGFAAADLLVEGAIGANLFVGLVVIAVGTLNGIAIVRVYLLLFTGARHTSTVSLELGLRERLMVLTLAVLILGGGIFPQPGISSRQRAAGAILQPSPSYDGTMNQTRPTN